jgi:hypothetical protein
LPLSYYVYYRIAQPAAAAACVSRVQREVRDRLGIQARVASKRGEPSLWMEIYEGVDDAAAFEALLAELVARTGFERVLAGGSARKTECFEALSCA